MTQDHTAKRPLGQVCQEILHDIYILDAREQESDFTDGPSGCLSGQHTTPHDHVQPQHPVLASVVVVGRVQRAKSLLQIHTSVL